MDFPPIAADSFKTGKGKSDGEANAEGFRMSFAANNRHRFRVEFDLPQHALPGPSFINFYASFYDARQADSIVETGISFSRAKHWNFFNNDHSKHPPEYRLGNQRKGKTLFMDVEFAPARHGPGRITSTIDGHSLVAVRPYHSVDRMRLVVAAGDRTDAFFTRVGVFLQSIDGKPPATPGFVEFMAGSKVHGQADAHCVLLDTTANGMRASMSAHKANNVDWVPNLN